ncbi:hypothetical protein GA0115256_141010 [Streptomyces sp. DconLS]|nr:hypothetical protein GA0115258_104092 [Streptomyces sp. LamerLS-31b]SCF99663.1 hypothetical protein GA0115256_141010 [Streptomyces sp. DconLS]
MLRLPEPSTPGRARGTQHRQAPAAIARRTKSSKVRGARPSTVAASPVVQAAAPRSSSTYIPVRCWASSWPRTPGRSARLPPPGEPARPGQLIDPTSVSVGLEQLCCRYIGDVHRRPGGHGRGARQGVLRRTHVQPEHGVAPVAGAVTAEPDHAPHTGGLGPRHEVVHRTGHARGHHVGGGSAPQDLVPAGGEEPVERVELKREAARIDVSRSRNRAATRRPVLPVAPRTRVMSLLMTAIQRHALGRFHR